MPQRVQVQRWDARRTVTWHCRHMDTYTVIHVEAPETESYWTVLDVTSGADLRDAHQFTSKQEAEALAEILNGKLSGELAQD